MILVDSRVGSKDLVGPLRKRQLDAEIGTIEFGDVEFCGQLEGKTRTVGIEIKTLTDMLSCLSSKRYVAGQLPGMLENYTDVYLVLEGVSREAVDGLLEVGNTFSARGDRDCAITKFRTWGSQRGRRNSWKRGLMATTLWSYLTSVEAAGVRLRMTFDRAATVACIAGLFKWWQKPQHATLKAFYSGDHVGNGRKFGKRDELIHVSRVTPEREAAAAIPGVGWVRSATVVAAFPYPEDVTAATYEEWRKLPGFGAVLAARVYNFLHRRPAKVAKRKKKARRVHDERERNKAEAISGSDYRHAQPRTRRRVRRGAHGRV